MDDEPRYARKSSDESDPGDWGRVPFYPSELGADPEKFTFKSVTVTFSDEAPDDVLDAEFLD